MMTPVGGSGDFAIDVAVQSDGKIVVAGAASVSDDYDLALIRYNPDGSLDPGFGAGGKAIIPAGAVFTGLNAIRIQSDGKIVMAGFPYNGTDGDIALWRTNADGSLDPSFGTGGKITTDVMGYDGGYDLLLQTDGKILVAGGSGRGFVLVRYLPEGGLDTAFGIGGIAVDDGNFLSVTRDGIVLQPDQKIVVAGVYSNWPSPADFVLARYDLNGGIDATFGAGGKTVITTGVSTGNLSGSPGVLMLRSDGKIEAAAVLTQNGTNGLILAHYLAGGNLNTSNGSGSMEVTAPGAAPDGAQAVAIQSDDKIVAVGSVAGDNGTSDLALNRFNRDGSPDGMFGVNGKIITDFGKGEEGRAVVIQPDGKIVVAGLSFGAGNIADFLVVRYLSDGSLDAGFGEGGKTVTDLGSNTNDVAAAAALQPDGKIVVTGNQESGSGISAAVVRYLPDGRLDPSFGNGGIVMTAPGGSNSAGTAIALQFGGKVLVAGTLENGSSHDFFLVRYNADGGIDASFGANGTVKTHFGDSDSATHTLLIQPNGQIILSGFTQVGSLFVPVLARYDSNGSLDAAFGTGGKVIGSPEMSGFFTAAALQADGKILMAGNSSGNTPGFLLTRFNGDGSIDTAFGVHGQVVTHLGFDRNFVSAIALYSDGKILAAGSGAGIGSDFDLALARYWP